MKNRRLGHEGPTVYPIGFGAMSFSDFYGTTSERESHAILDMAMDAGVSHLDTSNVYGMGRSETVIGNYIKANSQAQDHFVIATKGGITRNPTGPGNIFNNSPKHLKTELENSLRRLGVEAVDLYYLHRRDHNVPIEEVTETLATFVKSGKVKAIGFSEIAPTTLRRAHAVHPVAAVQSEYSLSTRSPELGLIQTCAELGVSMVAFSPVGRSLLTDSSNKHGCRTRSCLLKKQPSLYDAKL